MERMIDDNVKQKLLASLAEEPLMVLSTAYIYAKNYVTYGEDITKLWATAVQQQAILESARLLGWQDGYDSFKADYEKRLKADKNNSGNDCISRAQAIERLKLNFPISDGADNSRDRHRYMQALADLQAIKELPPVKPQEPKTGH